MIDEKRLTDEFSKLVSMDSESYEEREMADYLIRRLEALGLTVTEDEAWKQFPAIAAEKAKTGNLYAYLPARGEGQQAKAPRLFSAHMDTVSPGRKKTAILHEDGRITSDGSTVLGADDAAGLAEILEMLTVLQEEERPHPALEFVFCAAEEPYCVGSSFLEPARVSAREAYVLDLSGPIGRAAFAAPTILSVIVEIRGRASHAGFHPEDGIHALEVAAKALAKLPNGRNAAGTTVNFGTIEGGTGQNIVPEFCRITGEIRSLNHEDASAQAEEIERVFEEIAADYKATVSVLIEERIHAYRTAAESAAAQRFQRVCKKLELPGTLEETLGGSDLNQFCKHGVEGLVVANGMYQVHSTEEYTTVSDLIGVTELILELATDGADL